MSETIHHHRIHNNTLDIIFHRHNLSTKQPQKTHYKVTPFSVTIFINSLTIRTPRPRHTARQRATLSMTIWHHNSLSYCNITKSPLFAKSHTTPPINFEWFLSVLTFSAFSLFPLFSKVPRPSQPHERLLKTRKNGKKVKRYNTHTRNTPSPSTLSLHRRCRWHHPLSSFSSILNLLLLLSPHLLLFSNNNKKNDDNQSIETTSRYNSNILI